MPICRQSWCSTSLQTRAISKARGCLWSTGAVPPAAPGRRLSPGLGLALAAALPLASFVALPSHCTGAVCRLRAEATCRAWRRALRGLPFHTLNLNEYCGSERETKQQWVIVAQPPAKIVQFYFNRSAVLLHSLDRKVWQLCGEVYFANSLAAVSRAAPAACPLHY